MYTRNAPFTFSSQAQTRHTMKHAHACVCISHADTCVGQHIYTNKCAPSNISEKYTCIHIHIYESHIIKIASVQTTLLFAAAAEPAFHIYIRQRATDALRARDKIKYIRSAAQATDEGVSIRLMVYCISAHGNSVTCHVKKT